MSAALIPDQAQRQCIVEQLDKTMLVEAAAGTGKTTSMLDRMVALLRQGKCRIHTMAAVTFTRKAAAELRSRFQVVLEQSLRQAEGQERERLLAAVSRIEQCFIGTIHAFCGRLLRERPIEAHVDLGFREIEPVEDMQLRETAWADYVAHRYAVGDSLLTELSDLGLGISQLHNAFLEYANYPDVDDWPAPEVDLGDLTVVRAELRDYIRHMSQLIPTFPSDRGSDKLMATYERMVRLSRNRDLDMDADLFELLQEVQANVSCTQKCWPGGQPQGKAERDRWRDFATRRAQPLVERWLEKRYRTVIRVLAGAVEVYDQLRADLGQLNYQDLLIKAAGLLRDQPPIRRYFRRRFTHLLVDEFQDTDPIQARVMMYLTANDPSEQNWRDCRPVNGSLFVVGDPKQSIYRFRRADIVTYEQVKQMILDAGGIVVPLTTSFRTRGPLVQWVNRVFEDHFPAKATKYSPAVSCLEVGRQDDGQENDSSPVHRLLIPVEHHGKEASIHYEAEFIARHIRHALDNGMPIARTDRELAAGIPPTAQPADFLIITWNKKQLFEYGRALQQRQVPHEVTGSSALGQVAELQTLIDLLTAVSEPENPVALVAVLRGLLFGISDQQLYGYKKAGGRFLYRANQPDNLDEAVAANIRGAFQRLERYATWFRRLPPVAAVERIAFDVGLPMLALAAPGGQVQAGSMAKALQLLRAVQAEFDSIEELVEYLERLIDDKTEFDGLPVRPYERSVVRLMNLHKVKGLEAPIVFLANPMGKWDPPISLHVDRVGDRVRGYMAIDDAKSGRSARRLARPVSWQHDAAEEKKFEVAEDLRLCYVAATRAGTQLNVVQHDHGQSQRFNYWHFFTPYLQNADPLVDCVPRQVARVKRRRVTREEVRRKAQSIQQRWQACCQPTYAMVAAKEIAIKASEHRRHVTAGEHGTEWGTAIHSLLETAMRQPSTDLRDLAYAALAEQGLEAARAEEALRTVQGVMASEFWRRAQSSEQVFVEVPFQRCLAATESAQSLPTILRGVIDLVFRELGGWVVVDYKSDASAAVDRDRLMAHYRGQLELYADSWQSMTDQPVREKAVFFTATQDYVVL